jgi:uncharacterized protein (TIGR02145 family)
MKKHYFFLIMLIFISKISLSQNSAACILGDTLRLNINDYRGVVNWQQSVDNQNWTDIFESSAQLKFIPDTITKWVRAKIEEENCPSFYESPFIVSAVDTASFGFNRTNLSVEQLPVELVSDDANGLLIFDLDGNEFPLNVGDWLAGFAGQLSMKQIDAIIVQDGFANVYTSVTNVSVYDVPLNFGNELSGKVIGRVLTEAGDPVEFADINSGSQFITTDINGVFAFDNAVLHDKVGYITVNKKGYFEGSRTFIPVPGGNIVEIRMLKKNFAGSFNSGEGGLISTENIQLNFPSGSVTQNGVNYAGNVNVFVNSIDPGSANFFSEMPGNLIGNQYGGVRGLTSFGMIAVEMQSELGEVLRIADGHTVNLELLINPELESASPDTIDLWAFNENWGYWQDEGEAIKIGNSYIAELPHFSFWNCDVPWDAVFINGTVNDVNGNPLTGVQVTLSDPVLGSASDISNAAGHFGGLVPSGVNLQVEFAYACGNNGSMQPLQDSLTVNAIFQDTTITLSLMDIPVRMVSGILHNCDNQVVSNAYVINGAGVNPVAGDGSFIFNSCSETDSFRIVQYNPTAVIGWQSIQVNEGMNDLGFVPFCGADTLLTDTVSDIDGNVYNTVMINGKWWMAENLNTTRYANGDQIPTISIQDTLDYQTTTIGAWNIYNDFYPNAEVFGRLYNWFTAVDSRNVCPAGWHVPTDSIYISLIDSVGGYQVAGSTFKSHMYWNNFDQSVTNELGFSALPGGSRNYSGYYTGMSASGPIWTSSVSQWNSLVAWFFSVSFSGTGTVNGTYKNNGYSIRCIKD